MNKLAPILLVAIILITSAIVLAKPDTSLVPATNTKSDRSVVIPANAVEVADGVFDLGQATVNGKAVQGYAFVDYKKDFTHKPNHKPGGGGDTTCFSLLARGAKWKTTEQYVLDTTNVDGMNDSFVSSVIETSFNTWDSEVTFDVFGTRDTNSTVDGADTSSPDGKNEVMFGDISSSGAIAVTIVWGIFAGPPGGRELVEFDMVFDDVDFNFGDATLNASLMDLQNIATHEDGHALGLGHPSDSCTEETMFRFAGFGETKKRTLNAGDIDGVHALYG